MPELFIITGSNGAGKSSVGPIYLPQSIQKNYSVFDGDKLFMQKQKELWRQGIRANKEARKLAFSFVEESFDQLVEDALNRNDNFVYEGHFTNEGTWDVLRRFKRNGYSISLIFLGLSSPELSDLRVIDRSKEGGHYVPPLTVRDNFYGNLEKLNLHYAIIDDLQIIDTSETNHILLAHFRDNKIQFAADLPDLPQWFVRYLPALYSAIEEKNKTVKK